MTAREYLEIWFVELFPELAEFVSNISVEGMLMTIFDDHEDQLEETPAF